MREPIARGRGGNRGGEAVGCALDSPSDAEPPFAALVSTGGKLVERFQSSNHMWVLETAASAWMESQRCNCVVSWNRSSSHRRSTDPRSSAFTNV